MHASEKKVFKKLSEKKESTMGTAHVIETSAHQSGHYSAPEF